MTPIRKGSNPVKIPFAIKSTDPTLAAWCNEVRTCLRQLEARVPTANMGRATTGAAALQFKIYAVRYDSNAEKWYCKVRPGWVRNRNPDSSASDVIKDWMPEAGSPGVALDAAEPPEIEIADGQTVYCRVATTDKGIIEAAPTIEAATTPTAGTHFQPPNAATNGDLYFPLCNVTITGDPAVVTLEQIQQGGPIHVTPNLPEIQNIGGQIEVFKERVSSGDTYDFRTLEQLSGAGEPLIRVDDPQGDTVPFRRIASRATSPQINVDAISDDIIRVRGNNYDSSESAITKFDITVTDGLVSSFTKIDDGWWGEVSWYNGGGTEALRLTFESGRLIGVVKGEIVSGTYVENPVGGTEGAPGNTGILV